MSGEPESPRAGGEALAAAPQRLRTEIEKRRTFAIISHPDAGKSTLTEKLLLYGGAIHLAGSVKARRARRHVTSDWMEMERERGISVTSSVLQFDYRGFKVNLLDTPGHQDFSEDTYRTLVAADCAVMLLDNRKGVEEQTRKLFRVCRRRRLPLFTFVNKCDRVGVDPLQLVDDVEADLGVRCSPVTWPILHGDRCVGIFDRSRREYRRFERSEDHGESRARETVLPEGDPGVEALFDDGALERAREEVALFDATGPGLAETAVAEGETTPTFFGSALLNFGIEPFLEYFLGRAPAPGPREARDRVVAPDDPEFSGFVFKIQANMDPNHRDRIAFVRVCSGVYEPGATVVNRRSDETVRLTAGRQFLGQERSEVEEAYPGDVVGVHDRESLRVGDTLAARADGPSFGDIPRFPPEHFARVRASDPFRRKHLDRGLRQLSEEGAVQVFFAPASASPDPMIGVVGALQFDVLLHRLEHEYGVEARLEPLSYRRARWVTGPEESLRRMARGYGRLLVRDHKERPLLLFENDFALQKAEEEADDVQLHEVSP